LSFAGGGIAMPEMVLIVEDDRDWAEAVLGYEFEQMGYTIRVVSDLKSARQALATQSFSLVTVDMCLEEGRGIVESRLVLDYIRDHGGRLPCIIVSGSPFTPEKGFDLGREYPMIPNGGFIWKGNFDSKRLRDLVARLSRSKEDDKMPNSTNAMSPDHAEELKCLSQDLRTLSDLMADTKGEYEKGFIDLGRRNQLLRNYGKQRYEVMDKMEALMKGTGFERLHEALEKAESHEPEETIKSELKEEAKKQGWGDQILKKIEEHKGEIVSLVVSIAIELGKKAAGM